jgi:hypothetical protein
MTPRSRLVHRLRRPLARWAATCLLAACSGSAESATASPDHELPAATNELFTLLPSSTTGVRFANRLQLSAAFNVFTYRNFYNGGGAAIADLTGDGLPEIVLTANETGPRIYLNRGKFAFRDITEESGIRSAKGSWTTGVAIADVNGDGRLDIYICKAGPGEPAVRANELWINQGLDRNGVPTFKEMARQYGVADEGYTTQAAFLDYDGDGDLDLFVVNNSPRPANSFDLRTSRNDRGQYGGQRLYRNDGGHFVDVSVAAGIHGPDMAYGLGVVVSDFNGDGRPDLYVSNDFFERDYLYLNAGNGTFTDAIEKEMPVISYFSMGLDAADVDNDGWPDLYTTDMLPEDDVRLKTTSQFEDWGLYQTRVRNGYHHQSMRNMLQRNNGDGTFSDVGQLAGVARTDWSWSALIADFDLDGRKDIFVTNGIAKDLTAQDYVAHLADPRTMQEATNGGRSKVDFSKLIAGMTATPLANYAFHSTGVLHYANEATAWGLGTPSFSSGAAYGDLDGDGALDLVVNNIDQEAFVYRNNARALHPENRFLRVRLDGAGVNRFGIGARVTLFAGAERFMQEQSPVRGFQSSVDYVLDFGLGTHIGVDSLQVVWPGGRVSRLAHVATDTLITVAESGAGAPSPSAPPARPLLADVTAAAAIDFTHRENEFVDFDREPLIPKLLSTEGPALAVGDVDGDGLDDVYLGGAKLQPGRLFVQRRDGTFASRDDAVFAVDSLSEDVGATFFDANGDGRPDLYVVSGGSEYSEGASPLQDRLYLNDGHGHFRKATNALPPEASAGSRVAAADYDGDGAIDLFVGGRVVPWRYGSDPQSLLLHNDGHGHFTNVTATLAPQLEHIGMVTDAVWRDVDGDGRLDLVVVGEWMPITVFRNLGGGRLARLAVPGLDSTEGWWNRIVAGDFTGNGRVDFIVGNLGENSRLHATTRAPVTMVAKDFDHNDAYEQIISIVEGGVARPLPLRDDLLRALPMLAPRFPTYASYAGKTVEQIFTSAELSDALVRRARTFATTLVRNEGGGRFTLVPLPDEAQLAPVYGILPADVDRDGHIDLLLAGNFDGFKPEIGRMAASYGLLLRGDGRGGFTPVRARESGFFVPGQSRDIARVRTAAGDAYLVARNNDRPLLFRAAPAPRRIAARGTPRGVR